MQQIVSRAVVSTDIVDILEATGVTIQVQAQNHKSYCIISKYGIFNQRMNMLHFEYHDYPNHFTARSR